MFCFGGSTLGSHLFPFRTEKLSLVVAMIVFMAKVASRQNKVFNSRADDDLFGEKRSFARPESCLRDEAGSRAKEAFFDL